VEFSLCLVCALASFFVIAIAARYGWCTSYQSGTGSDHFADVSRASGDGAYTLNPSDVLIQPGHPSAQGAGLPVAPTIYAQPQTQYNRPMA